MLFSELYEIMANKVNFVGFKGGDRPNRTLLDPPLPGTHIKTISYPIFYLNKSW